MWISTATSVGPLRRCFLDLLGLERCLAHPHDPVDLTAFLHEEPLGRDVAVHDARGLDLDALVRADAAPHLAADDGLTGDYVPFHFPALADQDLAPGAHGAYHRSFDLDHA